jgi:MFS family permease
VIATRRGDVGHRLLFGAAVLVAPALLVALSASRWLPVCVTLLVAIGVAESAFATMQSTLVLLEVPERVRGGAMGILSACIGTQPLGTLAIGPAGGEHRGAAGVRGERARLAPRHRPPRRASRAEGGGTVTSTNP